MADDLKIRIKAMLDLDAAEAAKQIESQRGAIESKIDGTINIPVKIDERKSSEEIKSAIQRINTQNKIEFPIEFDTSGMDKRFDSVLRQIENFQKKIQEAGGAIKRMQLTPLGHIGTDKETGEIINEDAYRAVIQYQTAIGEVIQKTVEMTQSGNILSDYVDHMTVDFQRQRDTMNDLADAAAQYSAKLEALKQQAAGVLTGTANNNSLKALFDSIDFGSVKTQSELDAMVAKFKQAQAEVQALNAAIGNKKLAGTAIEQMNAELAKMPATLEKIKNDFAGITIPDDITEKIAGLEQGLRSIDSIHDPAEKIKKYSEMKAVLATIPAQLKNIQVEQQKLTHDIEAQQKAADQLAKLWARYQASGERYSAFKLDPNLNNQYKQLGATITHLKEQLAEAQKTGVWNPEITRGIQSANAQLGAFNNTVVAAGKNTKSLADQFKNAFSKFGTWLSATSIFMKVLSGLKDAISQVKTLDAAMVNLKKVTDETDESYAKFLQNTGKTAQRIGSTMSDLVESTSTFAKLGYSFKDAQELAEVATIFSNVGDFGNIETATGTLITAMKAFNLQADDAMSVADRINEVANRFAVSADDLSVGLTHAASAMNLAGNTIDQTIAMITAASEITQNAGEAGNAIKILSMRLRGAKAEIEAAGEETDGMCESTSKLRETILALTGSVDIMADKAGTKFKSTYQIMQEISKVWNDLSDINQAALLETIAGKMRGNTISALLTNMAQANKALETSLNSTGSALEEHGRWMDSIEAKEAKMKAAWQDFSDSIVNPDAVKGWYDALSGLLNILTQLVDKAGLLPLALGGIAGVTSAKGGLFGTATNSNGDIVGRIGNYVLGSGNFGLNKVLNGNVDTTIIGQYTEAVNRGVDATEAMRSAVTDASGQMLNLNGATRKALATETGAAKAMQQLGISTAATTAKTIAQTVAIKALNAALNIGIMALVSFAANFAIKAFDSLREKIDRARDPVKYLKQDYEELKEAFASTESDIAEVNDELAKTQKRISELQSEDNLSFIEKEELSNLQATNDELERRLENLQKIHEQQDRDKAENVKNRYKADYQQDKNDFLGRTDTYAKETQIEWDLDYVRKHYDWIKETEYYDDGSYRSFDTEDHVVRLRKEMEALYQYLDEYPFEDEFSEHIQEQIDAIDSVLNPGQYKTRKFNEILGLDEFKESIKEIQTLANNGELTTDAYLGYEALAAALEAVWVSAEEAVEQFTTLAKAQEEAAEARTALSLVYENWARTSNAQSVGSEIIGAQSYFSSITEEQYSKLMSAGDEYAACVENINGYMQLNIEKYNELIQAQYEEEKAAVAVGKAQAIEKYAENIQAIKAKQEALKILESRYDATTEGYEKWVNTLRSGISSLEAENSSILNEIQDYERLASQLNYATSAYKKWLDAQSAPNAGDAYDDMIKAMGQIKEGQENGKIGTAKYKAAVELLVPDGQDVSKYMSTLERYLTEDSSGLQSFIDDMYKRANPFLSKSSDGTYSFMEGVTVQDIAQGLGLTDELARYMLQALKDYGWDVNIFDEAYQATDVITEYADAVARLAEVEKELEEAQAGGDTSRVEELTQEAKELKQTIGEMEGIDEKTDVEKLKEQLEIVKSAYQELAEMKIDLLTEEQVSALTSVIETLNGMSEDGYTLEVKEGTQLESANLKVQEIQAAIQGIQSLVQQGVISPELAATLTQSLTEYLEGIQGAIEEYNKNVEEPKEAKITLAPDDQVSPAIKTIETSPHSATITLTPNDEAIQQWQAEWASNPANPANWKAQPFPTQEEMTEYNRNQQEEEAQLRAIEADMWGRVKYGSVNWARTNTVRSADLAAKGWEIDPDSYATLYSQTYSAGKLGDGYDYPLKNENVVFTVTPILPDGSVLSPEELEGYMADIFAGGAFDMEHFAAADNPENGGYGILIGWDNVEGELDDAYERMGIWANSVHKLAEIGVESARESKEGALAQFETTAEKVNAFNDAYIDANGNVDDALADLGATWDTVRELYAEILSVPADATSEELEARIRSYLETLEQYKAAQEGVEANTAPAVEVGADTTPAEEAVAEFVEGVEQPVTIPAEVDTSDAEHGEVDPIVVPVQIDQESLQEEETSFVELMQGLQSAANSQKVEAPFVDTSAYDEAKGRLDALCDEVVAADGQLNVALDNLGMSMEQAMADYATYLEYTNSDQNAITPQLDTRDAVEQLQDFIEEVTGQKPSLGLQANPSDAIKTANNAVAQINGMKATIQVSGQYTGTNGLPSGNNTSSASGGIFSGIKNLFGLAAAKGTDFSKEQDAIVGEKGIETWLHDGHYQIVGKNGAELIHLNRGDQILSNEETKQLFKNKKHFTGNAYASGTGLFSSITTALSNSVKKLTSGAAAVVASVASALNSSSTSKQTVSGSGSGNKDLGGNKSTTKKSSSGSSSASSSAASHQWYDDLVDWIPTMIENLKKKTDEYISYADKAVGYILKNKNLDDAIKNITEEVNVNLSAYDRYLKQANEIAARQGLSADIVSKIQNGTINIEQYGEETRNTISAYQKWYDLAVQCRDAVSELKDQQIELAKQKLDNITQYYENRITLLGTEFENYQKQIDKKIASGKEVVKDDYSDMIENTRSQIGLLIQERDALSNEFTNLVRAGTIKEGSDDWYEYTNQIKDFDNAITEAQISVEDLKDSANEIVLTNLNTALNAIKSVQDAVKGLIDLREAQGKTMNPSDYRNLIAASTKQIRNLEAQNEALAQQQIGLDVLSEEYQELQSKIDSNASSILSAKTQQEKWNDAIIDLQIDKLKEQNDEYKSQLELMDAIEQLEKAKQRRALIYREGQGFNYESIEGDIRDAKNTLDEIVLNRQIEGLEKSKAEDNLYDDYGNELAPIADPLFGFDLSNYYGSILNGAEKSALLASVLDGLDVTKLVKNADYVGKNLSVSIESGAINLSGVNDVNTLAEAITNLLPNALMQQLYKD